MAPGAGQHRDWTVAVGRMIRLKLICHSLNIRHSCVINMVQWICALGTVQAKHQGLKKKIEKDGLFGVYLFQGGVNPFPVGRSERFIILEPSQLPQPFVCDDDIFSPERLNLIIPTVGPFRWLYSCAVLPAISPIACGIVRCSL